MIDASEAARRNKAGQHARVRRSFSIVGWCHPFCLLVLALSFGPTLEARAGEFEDAHVLAEAGDAVGYYRLGRLYETGSEVEKDLFEAARMYEQAANRGHVEAQFSAALLLMGAVPSAPREPERVFRWLSKAANNEHSTAAFFMAMSYEAGEGVEANPEKAFEWYRRAAQTGSGGAMNGLARMYASGAGVRVDLARAYAWNQTSGTRGHRGWRAFAAEISARMNEQERATGEEFAKSLIAKYGDSAAADRPD